MRSAFVLILFLLPLIFQSCTGCNDDDYDGTKIEDRNIKHNDYPTNEPKVDHTAGGRVVIKMKKEGGVYKIPLRINGVEMDFIFDTGASTISISDLEASFLFKQGKISRDDILGKANFQDATGNITEGAIINLKEVTLGNRTIYNVRASVTNNVDAPLLLGQTALEKFGKISIDYNNLEIIFE